MTDGIVAVIKSVTYQSGNVTNCGSVHPQTPIYVFVLIILSIVLASAIAIALIVAIYWCCKHNSRHGKVFVIEEGLIAKGAQPYSGLPQNGVDNPGGKEQPEKQGADNEHVGNGYAAYEENANKATTQRELQKSNKIFYSKRQQRVGIIHAVNGHFSEPSEPQPTSLHQNDGSYPLPKVQDQKMWMPHSRPVRPYLLRTTTK